MPHLTKALSEDASAVLIAVEARDLVQTLIEKLDLFPGPALHLGQACMGALLLQALGDTDENEKLELQWLCDGPFGHLYTDCLGSGKVRGTIHKPHANVDSLDTSLGQGILQIRRVKDDGFIRGTGIVKAGGHVAEDLVQYLEDSEQRVCGMSLHVSFKWDDQAEKEQRRPYLIDQAAGYLIHVLPQESEEKFQAYRELWDRRMQVMGKLSEWFIPEKSEEATHHMISLVGVGSKPSFIKEHPVEHHCTCSAERAERALALLSVRERAEMQEEGREDFDVVCEYCGNKYVIAAPQS